jgi:RNA recognition motif-containing protein
MNLRKYGPLRLKKKFESPWNGFLQAGTINSSLGVLTPEVDQLCQTFLHTQFLGSTKARKNMRATPAAVLGWFDRVLAYAFLDKAWWKRFVEVVQELAPHGSHAHGQSSSELLLWKRLLLDTLIRAFRNVPWSSGIARLMVQQVESFHSTHSEWMTLAVAQQIFTFIVSQPSIQANYESGVLIRLAIIDFLKRSLLLVSSAGASQSSSSIKHEDVFLVRGYFMSTRDLLPYLTATNPSLCARVYSFWAELELRFLHVHPGSQSDSSEQLREQLEDAMNQATKEGVSIPIMRTRQVWIDATQLLGTSNAFVWIEYVRFELHGDRTPDHIKHGRSIFKQAFESMTSIQNGFDMTNINCLRAVAPMCLEWLQFERLYSISLEETHTVERNTLPLLAALKASEAQQAAWSAANISGASQDAAAAGAGVPIEEEEQGSWLTRPVQPRSANGPGEKEKGKPKQGGGGKDKSKKRTPQSKDGAQKPKQPKQSKGDASGSAPPATSGADTAAADGKGGKKNKRKREGEEESGGEPEKKKSKSDSSKPAAAATGDSSAAMDTSSDTPPAPAAAAIPPHTLFISHLAWTLKEEDHRALLGPYGSIVRLVNHRGSKAIKKPFVEVSYSNDEEAQAAETALQGKMLSGKSLLVSRVSPLHEKPAEKEKAAPLDEADPLSVYLKNLPRDREDVEQLVREYFESKCGTVTSVEIPKHAPPKDPNAPVHHTSSFRNVGVVRFAAPESTVKALALHMQPLSDVLISVVPNTQPAREKRAAKEAAQKAAPIVKKSTAFQPRAVATKHTHAAPLATASSAPIASNEDFRARLLGTKK